MCARPSTAPVSGTEPRRAVERSRNRPPPPAPSAGSSPAAGDVVETEFAKDRWDAFVLGVPARRGRNIAEFNNIEQPWLRESVKAWCRFRLGAGYSFGTDRRHRSRTWPASRRSSPAGPTSLTPPAWTVS